MSAPDPGALITPEEARRAIYVDFEGLAGEAPVMLGWLYAEGKQASEDRLVLRQDVFEPTLQLAVSKIGVDGFNRHDQERRSLGQSINDLARRAKAQKRLIVSWSQHELQTVAEAELAPGLQRMFTRNYRDGKATARRWRRTLHPDVDMPFDTHGGSNKLVRYLDLIGYELPPEYGLGQTTARIRRVRSGLEKRGAFDVLLDSQKDAWSALLLHNAVDCDGLRAVVMQAARGLSEVGMLEDV